MKHTSRPKSAAVKDIDIADILGQKYRLRIDVGKGNIDPPLVLTFMSLQLGRTRSVVTTTTTTTMMTTTKTLREHKLGHGIQPQPKVIRNSSPDFRIIRMSAGSLPICRGFNTITVSVTLSVVSPTLVEIREMLINLLLNLSIPQ